MSNIWTEEGVQKWLDDAGYDAKVLGIIRYKVGKQLRTDIEVTCVKCGKPFQRNWYNYRREGDGMCFECADKRRRQTLHQAWYARNSLVDECPSIVDLWDENNEHPPEYYALNSNLHANFYHKDCGHRWNAVIASVSRSILAGNIGCPNCLKTYQNTLEEFLSLLESKEPNIKYIDGFTSMREKCWCLCTVCGSKIFRTPVAIIEHGEHLSACSVCNGRQIGDGPGFKNSIWANDYAKSIWEQYADEDFMKTHMPYAGDDISIPCPDCGEIKNTTINAITSAGKLTCKCGDSNSYPNKFVFNVIRQLKLPCECEYNPDWALDFRYDCHLIDKNIIIENHGLQHYEYVGRGRSLEEEQENDRTKADLAIKNNICKYIVLDCRESNIKWIKNSIMNSELPMIYNFTEDDIDWGEADKYATKNIIKQMCEEWENGLVIEDASIKYGRSTSTIQDWLRKGHKFGWCNYDPAFLQTKVYCFQLDKEFSSGAQAEKETGVSSVGILQCCRGVTCRAGTHPTTNEPLVWCFSSEKDVFVPKDNASMKKVICIETMVEYKSEAEATKAMGGKAKQNIGKACMGEIHTAYGYHWSFADELTEEKIKQAKEDRVKPAYLYVYCLDTQTIYPSIVKAQTTTGDWHIYDFIMGTRKYAGKSRHTYYAVYNQKKKDGTIIPGAITLGLITEEEALAQLNTPQND